MKYFYEVIDTYSDIQPHQTSVFVMEYIHWQQDQERYTEIDRHYFQNRCQAKRFCQLANKYATNTRYDSNNQDKKDHNKDAILIEIYTIVSHPKYITDEEVETRMLLLTLGQ